MDALVASPALLPVADARRPHTGRAVLGAMLAAGAVEAFALVVKEFRPLGDHAPWMNDPYDVVTSFAIFFIPIVGGFSSVRLASCRRFEPLPVSRVIYLLHSCVVLLAIALATAASDWLAVVSAADRAAWTWVTPALVAGLGLVTAFVGLAAIALFAEARRLPRLRGTDPAAPDWLADATAIASRISRRLGPLEPVASRLVRLVDGHIWPWVRGRPISSAVLAAAGFAALFDVGSLREGYSPSLLVFVLVVAWCGMFVLLVASGSYLGLVRSPKGLGGVPRRLLHAALAGSASVPVTLALRDLLWWLVGSSAEQAVLADLDRLLVTVAAFTGCATLLVGTLRDVQSRLRRRRTGGRLEGG